MAQYSTQLSADAAKRSTPGARQLSINVEIKNVLFTVIKYKSRHENSIFLPKHLNQDTFIDRYICITKSILQDDARTRFVLIYPDVKVFPSCITEFYYYATISCEKKKTP